MFAMVALKMKELGDGPDVVENSFKLFSRFVQNEEPSIQDEVAINLIKQTILMHKNINPKIEKLLTVKTYRSLNGLILRNASNVTPISDFHSFIQNENVPAEIKLKIYRILFQKEENDSVKAAEKLITSDYFRKLCISGTAPLAIHNCMNHSCEPNVASMSCFTDHRVKVVALKDIQKGDELCISYIDENLPLKERQTLLEQKYLFRCSCTKCTRQKQSKKRF